MVEFVPVRNGKPPQEFIPGTYIVKVSVKYGQRDNIYSYREGEVDYFPFKTENEFIHLEGRKLLNNFRERIKNPIPVPDPLHEGPC